ncbi:MAG: hypothetical protein DSY83_01490, partial [Flavobacteriia bacterium]
MKNKGNNIKVMHFAHWSRSGITSLIKALAKNRDHSFVLLLDDKDFYLYYSEIENKLSLNLDNRSLFKVARIFFKFYREQKPEIVHVHSFTPFLIAFVLCCKSKLVFHVHNEYPYLTSENFKSRIKCCILRLCFSIRNVAVVAVSKRVKAILKEKLDKDSFFVANGIPDEGTKRALFTELPSRKRFYSACRIESQKNLKMAIELVERISVKHDVVYHIYGEGPEKNALIEFVKKRKLEDIVIFKGFSDMPQKLPKDYDFYLSCSNFEGFGLSIVDGLRGRNIVIVTPVGELRNYIRDGVDGFFIDFNLNESLAKIEYIISMDSEALSVIQKNG